MTLAALIILDDARPTQPVLGMSWPEFRMRRAVGAGARHLVVVADRVGRDVVEAIDRLRAEGLSTTLARTSGEVADLFHPDEAVLLLTGGMVVEDARLAELLSNPKTALLCVEPARAVAAHELIDAKAHWVGAARMTGAQIRATAAQVGDWDLASTLLRAAVAARAARIMLGLDDLIVDATTPAGAALASRVLALPTGAQGGGWGERWLLQPLTQAVIGISPSALPAMAKFGGWGALALFSAAPFAALGQVTTVAVALFLVGLAATPLALRARGVTGITGGPRAGLANVRDSAAMLLLALAVMPGLAAILLALAMIAFTALADRLLDTAPEIGSPYLADRAGQAAVLLVSSAFGQAGLLVGLALCAAHGLGTVGFLQNRLSRVLTSLR